VSELLKVLLLVGQREIDHECVSLTIGAPTARAALQWQIDWSVN
jgi:hypothetical protein